MREVDRRDAQPFLSIVRQPEGCDRSQTAALLAELNVLDLPTARLRLGQEPPMVIAQAEPGVAGAAADAIRTRGGDAFTFTFGDLEALGPTLKIARLRVVEGGIDVDLHRGLSTTLRRENVQVLVRAQLRETKTERRPPPKLGSTALNRSLDAIRAGIESATTHKLTTAELLDIHMTDGSVYEVDGRRFDFSVLGDLKGYSDKPNMDNLCELIAHLAPDEVVDTWFRLWRPPAGYRNLRVPDANAGEDDLSFTFYSRWAALTYRHVMGAST